MNTIRYVTAVHGLTTEDYGEAPILTCDDVNQILDRRLKMLNNSVDQLEKACDDLKERVEELERNRGWLWNNVNIIKRFLVGDVDTAEEKMEKYAADSHNVLGGLDLAWNTKCRLDELPDSCRDVFGKVITDCLTPKLETFGKQIGMLKSKIESVEKVRETMSRHETTRPTKIDETKKTSWFGRMISWFRNATSKPAISEEA